MWAKYFESLATPVQNPDYIDDFRIAISKRFAETLDEPVSQFDPISVVEVIAALFEA